VQYSFSGSAVYTSAAAWRFEGRILAAPVTAATDLVLALGRDAERGLALSTHGSLDGARIDGELTLPGDLPATTDLPAWITALNTRLRGSLSVPHLSFGGIEIEGLELHATDTAVSGIAPR
jgi:hypothetical protein